MSSSERITADPLEQLALSGDQQAMARLFEQYRSRLSRMVSLRLDRRLRGRVAPSDVLQDAFLEVSRRTGTGQIPEDFPFFLWVRSLTAQRLLQVHRAHLGTAMRDAGREITLSGDGAPAADSLSLADQLLAKLTSPSQVALRTELQLLLQETVNSLDDVDREIVTLRHFEQLGNSEVAIVLGIPQSAASKRYIRALRRLRDILVRIPGFEAES